MIFVAWLGVSLLARLPVHRFPRTNESQLFHDAQIALAANLLTSVLVASVCTAMSALWYWLRG